MVGKLKWVILCMLLIAGLVMGNLGCSKTGSTTIDPATTTAPATAPKTGNTLLRDLVGRTAEGASLKYDLVMTIPGAPAMTSKVWEKNNKMRTELIYQGGSSITLIDSNAGTMYVLNPAQNTASKMPFNPNANKSVITNSKSYPDFNPKTGGTEIIDGKVCTIFEFTGQGRSTRMWFWQDRGLLVKLEETATTGNTTFEYKNYDLSVIPDSMFELPAGVQIIQAVQ